jgi:hypothetical protein
VSGFKVLLCATALLVPLTLVQTVNAQIVINAGPPVCPYGYYGYSPYSCAPVGFYGPGYFYNGIFLGMGPWANWGYNHGWGGHRFNGGGGGRYVGSRGYAGGRGYGGYAGGRSYNGNRGREGGYAAGRTNNNSGFRGGSSAAGGHSGVARGGFHGGGGSHGGGESHGGGSHGEGGHR